MQTFLRRLEILNYLRHQRRPVSTETLIEHLCDSGLIDDSEAANPRSLQRLVQRDLQFLLGERDEDGLPDNEFGLVMQRGQSKTLLWQLDPYAPLNYDFERMPAYMALALSITRQHLQQILPANTRQELSRLFEQADLKLQQQERKLQPHHYHKLTSAVAFFQRGQSLQAPQFEMAILDSIYRAILLGRRVEFDYSSGKGLRHYDVHPYGVVFMLPKVYLLGIKEGDDAADPQAFRSFLVHRIEMLQVSSRSNCVPEDFKLSTYLQSGHMDVLLDTEDPSTYQLELSLQPQSGSNLLRDLESAPISPDQRLEQVEGQGETWYLRATVRRTVQLRNWLLSLGGEAKVLAPSIVREDLQQHLQAITQRYAESN